MKRMKYFSFILAVAAVLLLLVSASAEQKAIGPNLDTTKAIINVHTTANTSVTFSQNQGRLVIGSNTTSEYGYFTINIRYKNQSKSVANYQVASVDQFAFQLAANGDYVIEVNQDLRNKILNDHPVRGYLLLLKKHYWSSFPTWSLTFSDTCDLDAVEGFQLQTNKDAALPIYYRTLDGKLLDWEQRTVSFGTTNIRCQKSFSGYTLYSDAVQKVTVSSNGKATPDSLTFYFTEDTVSATVDIQYVYGGSAVLVSQMTLAPGTHTITAENPTFTRNGITYHVSDSQTKTVTVYSNGAYSPNPVVFHVDKEDTGMIVAVSINHYGNDGVWLGGRNEFLSPGSYKIVPDADVMYQNGNAYYLTGTKQYNVTVYSNGTASATHFEFYYTREGDPSYNLDQTAVISKSPIFPRPGPNIGKNEYNYEVLGQTVTVHGRAPSGSKWWVCFSGDLRCEGKVFHLDHMWISESYLDAASYDLYALPVVTVYDDGTVSPDDAYYPGSVSYNMPIYYMSNEGELLYDRTEELTPGTHIVQSGSYFSNNDWAATSASSVTVTVYDNGTASPNIVYFYFARKNRPASGATATVIEKLYLRTGPGKPPQGQPNNSYETFMCPGAEVTVVAKAYHKSSGRWWLKLSGSVYDNWNRQTMNVTDFWTEYRYLDENSFNINSIPEVAGY